MSRIRTYKEFWPYYLQEHRKRGTKILHVIGTTLGLCFAGWLIYRRHFQWLPLALVPGYGFAWFSHFFIEKNRPATFKYPFWSFISDFRMAFLFLIGKIR